MLCLAQIDFIHQRLRRHQEVFFPVIEQARVAGGLEIGHMACDHVFVGVHRFLKSGRPRSLFVRLVSSALAAHRA